MSLKAADKLPEGNVGRGYLKRCLLPVVNQSSSDLPFSFFFDTTPMGLAFKVIKFEALFSRLALFCSFLAFFRASSFASSGVLEKVNNGGGASGSSEEESEP